MGGFYNRTFKYYRCASTAEPALWQREETRERETGALDIVIVVAIVILVSE